MTTQSLASIALATTLALSTSLSQAHGVQCGDLRIAHPYATPSQGIHKTGAVYFVHIKNEGQEADQLLSARSEVAATVEIHEMRLADQVMRMRAVPQVALPGGEQVSFRHGQAHGHHLMLLDLKQPLKVGDRFAVTLQFRRAGECQAEAWVEAPKADAHRH
jgi:periplasmic copper chaperone A